MNDLNDQNFQVRLAFQKNKGFGHAFCGHKLLKPYRLLIALFAVLAVAGCGMGTQGDSGWTLGGKVTAYYSKGPVTGASCTLKDAKGLQIAGPVKSIDGHIDFGNLPQVTGLLTVECSAGSFRDESTGAIKNAPIMRGITVKNSIEHSVNAVITPFTEMAFKNVGGDNGNLAAFQSAARKVAGAFGLDEGVDILSTLPTDINAVRVANNPAGQYATALAAFSQLRVDKPNDYGGDDMTPLITKFANETKFGSPNPLVLQDVKMALSNLNKDSTLIYKNVNPTIVTQVQNNINGHTDVVDEVLPFVAQPTITPQGGSIAVNGVVTIRGSGANLSGAIATLDGGTCATVIATQQRAEVLGTFSVECTAGRDFNIAAKFKLSKNGKDVPGANMTYNIGGNVPGVLITPVIEWTKGSSPSVESAQYITYSNPATITPAIGCGVLTYTVKSPTDKGITVNDQGVVGGYTEAGAIIIQASVPSNSACEAASSQYALNVTRAEVRPPTITWSNDSRNMSLPLVGSTSSPSTYTNRAIVTPPSYPATYPEAVCGTPVYSISSYKNASNIETQHGLSVTADGVVSGFTALGTVTVQVTVPATTNCGGLTTSYVLNIGEPNLISPVLTWTNTATTQTTAIGSSYANAAIVSNTTECGTPQYSIVTGSTTATGTIVVSSAGVVSGFNSGGTVRVKATLSAITGRCNASSNEYNLTISVPTAIIDFIDPSSTTPLVVGDTRSRAVNFTASSCKGGDFIYTSDDPSYASVDAFGVVTAKQAPPAGQDTIDVTIRVNSAATSSCNASTSIADVVKITALKPTLSWVLSGATVKTGNAISNQTVVITPERCSATGASPIELSYTITNNAQGTTGSASLVGSGPGVTGVAAGKVTVGVTATASAQCRAVTVPVTYTLTVAATTYNISATQDASSPSSPAGIEQSSGVAPEDLKLRLNGGAEITLSDNTKKNFSNVLAEGDTYTITISKQPTGKQCTLTAASGTVGNADVDIKFSCSATTQTSHLFKNSSLYAMLRGNEIALNRTGHSACRYGGIVNILNPVAFTGIVSSSVIAAEAIETWQSPKHSPSS